VCYGIPLAIHWDLYKYATLTSSLKEFTNDGEALDALRNVLIANVLHDVT